jgi:hypothetical protein
MTIELIPIRRSRPDVQELIQLLNRAKGTRTNWDWHWQEVKDRVWPHGADFTTQRAPGDKRTEMMLDATAALGLERFASALESLLTPRQKRWHSLKPMDEDLEDDSEVMDWLELVTDRLFAARAAPTAGLYSHLHECYKSLGAYGNSCLYVDSHPRGGLRYMHVSINQTYIALDPFGQIDTIYRCYKHTAKQSIQTWGDKAPQRAQEVMATDPFREHEYLHLVRPNRLQDFMAPGPRGMAFESIYACLDDQTLLSHGGYTTMPYLYSRYTVNPSEPYGRGPAMLVLPNIKILQEQKKTLLRAGHKVVDPPLLLRDDGVLGTGGKLVRLMPGGQTFGGLDKEGRPMVQPLITGARLDLTREMMQDEKKIIADAFLESLWLILMEDPSKQMTATEILERANEKGQLLGPAIGRQQSELLGPLIEREVDALLRSGELPPPPPQLESYEIEYESPGTQMQKADEMVSIARAYEIAAPFIAADPGLMQKFNGEEIIDRAVIALGVPRKVVRDDKEYAAARQKYDAMLAAQQAIALGQGVGAAAKDFAAADAAGGQVAGP